MLPEGALGPGTLSLFLSRREARRQRVGGRDRKDLGRRDRSRGALPISLCFTLSLSLSPSLPLSLSLFLPPSLPLSLFPFLPLSLTPSSLFTL